MKTQPDSQAGLGKAVYLDYAATTPAAPDVVAEMNRYLGKDGVFGNPASRSHNFGRAANQAVENARRHVAKLLNAAKDEIVWTSGATESINLALKGVVNANGGDANRHILTSSIEHKAVLDTCRHLEDKGFRVTYLKPDTSGLIRPEIVERALSEDTVLVSLMHVNNEVGTITDIEAIAEITRARGVIFHVDAAQSVARLPIDTQNIRADLISLSSHKMYGPKGVGALYIRHRPDLRIEPLIHGGDQERGFRSGTLPTHQLVGMGKAAQLLMENRQRDMRAMADLDALLRRRLSTIPHSFVNGNQEHRVAGILSVGFACVESESLMLSLANVAISSGSACTSSRVESSHVLRSLGCPEDLASCSVRISLGNFTTSTEIEFAALQVSDAVHALRQLSPSWKIQQTRKSQTRTLGKIEHPITA